MSPRVLVLMASCLLAVAGEASAQQQVRFQGVTTVDMVVVADALRKVQEVGVAEFDCARLDAVEAEVLPADYEPADTPDYSGGAPKTHERWVVTLCGKPEPFLVRFWPAPQGGTMFHVRYPFPRDARPPAGVDGRPGP